MKKLAVLFAVIVCAACASGQETWQAEIKIETPHFPFWFPTSGHVWLTGNRMVCLVRSLACYKSGAIHGPAERGSNAPVIFPLDLDSDCAANQIYHSRNEFFLTDAQVEQLRAGLWYVLLHNDRSQIVLDRVCRFLPTNAIEFTAVMRGRAPAGIPLSHVRCGLTGDNFSYEIMVPADFGPYGALIWDNIGYAYFDPIVVDLGTAECVPVASSNLLPQCVIRGAVCAPSNYIGALLSGRWQLTLGHPLAPFNYQGQLKPVDSDHDGVPDYRDQCPATATNALVNAAGCSLEDLCPCAGPWKTRWAYLSCLVKTTQAFLADGLITVAQRRAILRQALHSGCGKQKPQHKQKPHHPHSPPLDPRQAGPMGHPGNAPVLRTSAF